MLLCFDYDGVIVDSFAVLLSYCQQAQRALGAGRPPQAEDLQTIESLTFDALGAHIGLEREACRRFAAAVFALQRDQGWPAVPFDGIDVVFAELTAAHDIVVVTASESATVSRSLAAHGLRAHVAQVLGGESGLGKAQRIEQAMQALGHAPDGTWMIGDAISDIREGKRAGVCTAAVTWGYQPERVLAAERPHRIVRRVADLREIGDSSPISSEK
jgi:phosphoglycolate phosphatase